jgi:hypothetical protein
MNPKSAANGRLGGRPKGSLNKATADIRELARKYVPAALEQLAHLSVNAQSESARVAAIKEILDRAYGKSMQALEHSGNEGGAIKVEEVTDEKRARALAAFLARTMIEEKQRAEAEAESKARETRACLQLRRMAAQAS